MFYLTLLRNMLLQVTKALFTDLYKKNPKTKQKKIHKDTNQ